MNVWRHWRRWSLESFGDIMSMDPSNHLLAYLLRARGIHLSLFHCINIQGCRYPLCLPLIKHDTRYIQYKMVKRKAKDVGDEVHIEPRRSSRQKVNNAESLKERATTSSNSYSSAPNIKEEIKKETASRDSQKGANVNGEVTAPKTTVVGWLFPLVSYGLYADLAFTASYFDSRGPFWTSTSSSQIMLHTWVLAVILSHTLDHELFKQMHFLSLRFRV